MRPCPSPSQVARKHQGITLQEQRDISYAGKEAALRLTWEAAALPREKRRILSPFPVLFFKLQA